MQVASDQDAVSLERQQDGTAKAVKGGDGIGAGRSLSG